MELSAGDDSLLAGNHRKDLLRQPQASWNHRWLRQPAHVEDNFGDARNLHLVVVLEFFRQGFTDIVLIKLLESGEVP